MKVVCSIQARLGSTRLPGKVLFELGDKRVIEWVMKRGLSSEAIDTTFLAVGGNPENDALIELCERNGYEYVHGHEDDLVARHKLAIEVSNCDVLCRVTGDCPFVPTSEITRLVREHLNNDAKYTTNVAENMPIGTAVDVIDPTVIVNRHREGHSHPVRHLRDRTESDRVVVSTEAAYSRYGEAHTAVDTPEDYWRLKDAIEAVGDDPLNVTQWVSEQH